MDGDHPCAEILGDMRQFGRVEAVMIPAHPHLHSNRHRYRFDRGLDQGSGEFRHAHQRRARVTVNDLLDRAAHIDVDDRRTALLIELGRLGHLAGIATRQLQRHGFLDRMPCGLLQRLARFADHCGAGDHLGDIQSRTITPYKRTKRHIGHPRHRRQDDRHVERDVADLDRADRRVIAVYHVLLKI